MLVRDRPLRSLVAIRGAQVVPIAHCAMPGCPFAWPADTRRRVCPDHDDSRALDLAAVALGIELSKQPGDRSGDGAGGR